MSAAAQQAHNQQLLGSGQGQFNLEAVRLRAGELRTSLVEVVNGLSLAPERLQWEDVLKQYAAINYQVTSLRETLRGVLRQVVVHPGLVDSPALSQVLPIQLSSALTPEQAEAEKQLLQAEEQRLVAAGVQRSVQAWYEATDQQLEDYERLISSLTVASAGAASGLPPGSGGACLDPQSEIRKGMAARSAAISRAVSNVRQGLPVSGPTGPAAGGKRARAAQQDASGAPALDPVLRQLLTGEASKAAHHQQR